MSPEEFKRMGYALIDWIAEYRAKVEELPVMAQVQPGEIKALFEKTPPQQAEGLEGIQTELGALLPGLTNWQSPSSTPGFPPTPRFPPSWRISSPPGWARPASPGRLRRP